MKILNASYRAVGSVNADGSPALPTGEAVYVVRLRRVRHVPRSVTLARFRRWRWGVNPDPRTTTEKGAWGYTFTRSGALKEIGNRIQHGTQGASRA